MNARFNPQAEDLQRLQVGPIGPHLQSFAALVSQQGYCNVNGWLKIRLVAKLSRWLHQRRISLNELNETRIAAFLNARWKRLARHSGDQITMTLLLRHLRQAKVVAPPPLTNGSDLELMVLEYQGFLLSERSLMPSTTGKYLEIARRFLSRRFPDGKLYLKKLQARDVTDFVLRHSLATGMLRNGASLAQIGQVLRHQLPQTTEIYAKVDFNALRALALPWTGGAL